MVVGGVAYVFNGAVASATLIADNGIEEIFAGGIVVSETVSSGGTQYDLGTASGVAVNGIQYVYGSAAATIVGDGGVQDILAGGVATDATIANGGIQYDAGQASGTTVSAGGVENVLSGGVATGTTVDTGGFEIVYLGGAISGATISGGELDLQSGATAGSSTITFASGGGDGGILKIDGTGTFDFLVAGFAVPDEFDLSAVNFATATKSYSGNASSGTLTVTDGTNAVSILLLGNYSLASFNLTSEGGGGTGTIVTDPPPGSAVPDLVHTWKLAADHR
jgi:autotransporter passenger strand-loop-strand repeat protein